MNHDNSTTRDRDFSCEHPRSLSLEQPHTVIGRLLRHRWAAAGFGSVALFGMVAASAIVPPRTGDLPVLTEQVVERLALDGATVLPVARGHYFREERIQRGDTLGALLKRLGIDDDAAEALFRTHPQARQVARQMAPGKSVSAETLHDGRLQKFFFPLNGQDQYVSIERQGETFKVSVEALKLDARTEMASGEIEYSLFGATDAAGIPDSIASQLADIFAGDIDFHRDLRKGDRFSLVYEMFHHRGQPLRGGRILAAEFTNDGKTHSAYWFAAKGNKGGYYSGEGKSLKKAFLRSPLEFSRVTSGFSTRRFHPVLNTWRAHKGVDYGAPTGTKVRSVADGTVEFAGRQGGYGNLVIIRHQGSYSTAYGHLNGFASGLRRGSPVSQGDTIGYVGSTGLASGPHLHYEFRIKQQQVNPLAVTLPAAIPLDPAQVAQFRHATVGLRDILALTQNKPVSAEKLAAN